jgi:hypothetical protein
MFSAASGDNKGNDRKTAGLMSSVVSSGSGCLSTPFYKNCVYQDKEERGSSLGCPILFLLY